MFTLQSSIMSLYDMHLNYYNRNLPKARALFISFVFFFFKQKTAYEIVAVTGVQTCALPISGGNSRTRFASVAPRGSRTGLGSSTAAMRYRTVRTVLRNWVRYGSRERLLRSVLRSEERRVGKEGRSRWSPYP